MRWKDIEGHEEYYEVSSNGDVRNKKTNKVIIGDINNAGYYRVTLYNPIKKRYFRHRLVAAHFIENNDITNKKFVNHIDGVKSNNKYTNLEWVSQSDNEKHAFQNGLKHTSNKVAVEITVNKEVFEFESMTDAANFLNIDVSGIHYGLKKNGWKSKGIKIRKLESINIKAERLSKAYPWPSKENK